MMMQQDHPEDYVIASGERHTLREFVEIAFKHVGIDVLYDHYFFKPLKTICVLRKYLYIWMMKFIDL